MGNKNSEIRNQNPESGWISVADRLPEKLGTYLVFCRYRNGSTKQDIKLFMPRLQRFTSEAKAVLYWRELPADPEEETAHAAE